MPIAAKGQAPVYFRTFADDVWSPVGGGAFRVAVSSEDYSREIWERSVEDSKWVESGGFRTTTGKYYAYGDLVAAALGHDSDYLYLSFQTVGAFVQQVGEDPVYDALKAQYFMYFGVGNDPAQRYLVNLGNGSSINAGGFMQVGKLYHDRNQDVFGSGLRNTYDSTGGAERNLTDGFEFEVGGAQVYARSNGVDSVEMALRLSSAGLAAADMDKLGFLYFGAATSNPSSNGDLFVNDEFREAPGQGQEYDTLGAIPIPEPSTAMVLALAAAFAACRRTR